MAQLKKSEYLICPWERVPADARQELLEHARVRGEIAADGYYRIDEQVLLRDAPLYYAEIVNQAVERAELSPADIMAWAESLSSGATDSDPRIQAFAEGFRSRVSQWRLVRGLAGEEGVRTMVRTGHPAGAVMEEPAADAEVTGSPDSGGSSPE